ncbi:NADH dehydrogenase subunit 4L (mitochondrion) [Acanthaster planci]|uniref:NADH-ubiquinone oxidoreductase chain 4L n=1 Tax=Acanthaster planci TaxID=133434 RepID=Q2L685_ACAPL|nr:NADH dehydrogenase subunit 4L [Acanthaster planci]BAE79169.1 NADH dehydrogenase subunit 4L [Acanthaster planci]
MTPIFISTISIYYLGLLGILINRLHFLSILLCLELLLISLFLSMTIWALNTGTNLFVANNLILLTLSACEASAGLSLMVALSRTHNSDLVIALNILQQ